MGPQGFRDVYWCYNLNEPVIIDYENDKPGCSLCNYRVDTLPDEGFLRMHKFIKHILKPKKKD